MLKQMPILINVQAKLENKSPHEADYPYGNADYQGEDVGQEAIREGFHRLQIQFVDFPVKGETGNAQHFGGQGIIPSTLTERPFDGPAFQFLQVQFLVIEIPGLSFLLRQEEVFGAQDVVLTQDDRPFQNVLKLTHITRPSIFQQLVTGFTVQSGNGFTSPRSRRGGICNSMVLIR